MFLLKRGDQGLLKSWINMASKWLLKIKTPGTASTWNASTWSSRWSQMIKITVLDWLRLSWSWEATLGTHQSYFLQFFSLKIITSILDPSHNGCFVSFTKYSWFCVSFPSVPHLPPFHACVTLLAWPGNYQTIAHLRQ